MSSEIVVYLGILEDDETWSRPILKAIEQYIPNCQVRIASEGKAFCRLISQQPPPNILILDVNTPGMNGLEVLKKVRSRSDLAWLPVVMFSSDPKIETEIECLGLGASAYVRKPTKDIHLVLGSIIDKYAYRGVIPEKIKPLLVDSMPKIKGSVGSLDDFLASL